MIDQYSYEYDLLGNKRSVRKNRQRMDMDAGLFLYEYDALNRITGVKKDSGYIRQYEYDSFGNRSKII